MANQRRPLTSLHGLPDAPAHQRGPMRWLLIAGGVITAALVLAWIDGGEQALRPIAERIELPEQPQ